VNGGSGLLVTRTAAQVLSDIGAASSSSLSGYLPLTGGTLTGALNGTTATFSGNLYAAGNVGIGTTSTRAKLSIISGTDNTGAFFPATNALIVGANTAISSNSPNLAISSNSTAGIDVGASVGFGGLFLTSGDLRDVGFGMIKGAKESATLGSADGYLSFSTYGAGGMVEKLRIASTGNATFSGNVNITNSTASIIQNGTGGGAWTKLQNNGTDDWVYGTRVGDATNNYNIYNIGTSNIVLSINKSTNAITFSSLAGTGSRMVVASSTGVLSATTAEPVGVPAGSDGQLVSYYDGGVPIAIGRLNMNNATGYVTPTTGTSINLLRNGLTIINPAGTLAALTLVLPSSPAEGEAVRYTITQSVSSLSYSGGTVVAAPALISGRTEINHVYRGATSSWY
jgi:hypothetical protein